VLSIRIDSRSQDRSGGGMHVNGQLVVPAGGQLTRTAAKAGTQRVSLWPQDSWPTYGPSSTAVMLAHDSMATNVLLTRAFAAERVTRIELAWPAWKYSTRRGRGRRDAGRAHRE
jgi:hypothetical protein